MPGMVDVNASVSASSSATSGSQVSANSGGVFYKSNQKHPPYLWLGLAAAAAVVAVIYFMRR